MNSSKLEATADPDSSQRVLAALKEARSRLEAAERAVAEPIAVIGMGCRFPGGADGPDAYWRLLLDGVDAVGEIPRDRYDVDAIFDPKRGQPGKIYTRKGAFLAGIDQFDAAFFSISPREAVNLDPQQRLLLEVAWEALEHAGQNPDQLRGSRSGVFVGIGRNDYFHRLLRAPHETMTALHATGNGPCFGPGRLGHVLDFKGPNMAIDTACSSSLTAVHLACQSLRLRECDLAIAGGCHVHLSPKVAIMLSMSRVLAADGRSKTFDASADGFGQGEGCGIIVLRRLSDALGRGDNILALIRGSAVNHDGHSSGLTVPNAAAQEQLVRDALANARVEPRQIGYVEAHGTGTPLGDPLELEALAAVLCLERRHDDPLIVGSVKTNLGHLEAAAGIAGLIKVVLALQHGRIPAHLHLRQPNPSIAWDELPIRIPTQLTAWERTAVPRVAGVTSLGMSGTNAHVVLQEAPSVSRPRHECERPLHVVTLSARSAGALREQARRLDAHLVAHKELPLEDVAFTMKAGRTNFPVRVGLVAASRTELSRHLSAVASGQIRPVVLDEDERQAPGIVFLFSGQGSQYGGMARQLYATEPLVRRVLDRCDEILRPLLRASLCEVLFADASDGRLGQTLYTQPALFAVEYALAELWRSWGVVPRAVLGHSVGEYVAACVAGVFSLEDGLQLIAERSRMMQALPRGSMAAILASESRVREAIGDAQDVSVAAINGVANIVIAGADQAVETVLSRLEAQGVGFRRLRVSHAFHSPMMEPMLAPFAAAARRVTYAAPRLDFVSNLTGQLHTQAPTADYWVRHVREPVRFAEGLDTIKGADRQLFVEVGPGSTLIAMAGRHLADRSRPLFPSLLPEKDEWAHLLATAARLYEHGTPIDWTSFDHDFAPRRVPLPTYPFERQRFWCEEADAAVVDPAPVIGWKIPAYRLRWRHVSGPRTEPQSRPEQAGRWIVFASRDGIGQRLGRLLEERGHECIYVEAGAAFAAPSAGRWVIDPDNSQDFSRLFDEIPEPSHCMGVVFAWNCEAGRQDEPSAELLLESQMRSCGGALHLVQAMVLRDCRNTPLWLVTRNAITTDSVRSEMPDLSHAAIWGMGKAIALEHPEFWGGMIDLPKLCDDGSLKLLVQELESERSEDHLLIRDGKRFVARLEPFTAPVSGPVALRDDAAYLITGGLGALGLCVARWMVERGARNIVLLGRREPSPGAQSVIAELRRRGATVVTFSADVAEPAELRRVFSGIQGSLPPLRGVVHAAGLFAYDALPQIDARSLERVLRPKVNGAWLLHQLTSHLDLDFFVCFSSVASLWGSKGQAHYAAANAFLDALARYRHRRGLPALSVAWGPWDGDGMVTPEMRGWLARMGLRSLRPQDALSALERSLGCGDPYVAIADVDWTRFHELFELGRKRPLLENIVTAKQPNVPTPVPDSAPLEDQFAHLTVAERGSWLVRHLQQEVSAVLGLGEADRVDTRAGFFRLGMDSVMAVDIRNRLAKDFRVTLSATVVFDYPNIAELAAHLAKDALGWEQPTRTNGPLPAPSAEAPAVASDPLPENVASKLARLETLMREI